MSSEDGEPPRRQPYAEQIADPESYNRQQRFQEIHEARQRVTDHIATMTIQESTGNAYPLYEITRLAHHVAMYVMELEPLIEKSDWDSSQFIPEGQPYNSITEWAALMGMTRPSKNGGSGRQPAGLGECVRIFSLANKFIAQVGMDLELKEDDGDAGFEYSDILGEGPPGEGDFPEIEEVNED